MEMKRVAIIQSNYIPWKGYFDIIARVDEFILLDDVQYTKRDWRNRNRIKTKDGLAWLTIPVHSKGESSALIREMRISEPGWNRKHWETIRRNYAKSACFREYEPILEDLFLGCQGEFLTQVNHWFIEGVCRILGIRTKISFSMDYETVEGKNERLISLCLQAGGTEYLSGPAAQGYMDEAQFAKEGIAVAYMDYSGYPEYRQLYPPFEHGVSIIDLILNEGPDAKRFMKGS
jgi:hypothetical protein